MYVLLCPFVILVFLLVAFFALLFRRYFYSLFFLIIACLLNIWCECYPIHLFNKEIENESKTIKVLIFNVKSTQENFDKNAPSIAQFLINEDADVIFLSEIYAQRYKYLFPLLTEIYPFTSNRDSKAGYPSIHFLSKLPITGIETIKVDNDIIMNEFGIDEKTIMNERTKHSNIYNASFEVDGNHVYIVGVHLIGNNYYTNTDSYSIDSIDSFDYLNSYLKNIRESYQFRALEANAICKTIDSISSPLIVMGDMNDIGGSYAIRALESKGLEDAWWKGGFGYGCTFEQSFLHLRLDHILFTPSSLQLRSVKVVDTGLSDHKCLVAEFDF